MRLLFYNSFLIFSLSSCLFFNPFIGTLSLLPKQSYRVVLSVPFHGNEQLLILNDGSVYLSPEQAFAIRERVYKEPFGLSALYSRKAIEAPCIGAAHAKTSALVAAVDSSFPQKKELEPLNAAFIAVLEEGGSFFIWPEKEKAFSWQLEEKILAVALTERKGLLKVAYKDEDRDVGQDFPNSDVHSQPRTHFDYLLVNLQKREALLATWLSVEAVPLALNQLEIKPQSVVIAKNRWQISPYWQGVGREWKKDDSLLWIEHQICPFVFLGEEKESAAPFNSENVWHHWLFGNQFSLGTLVNLERKEVLHAWRGE